MAAPLRSIRQALRGAATWSEADDVVRPIDRDGRVGAERLAGACPRILQARAAAVPGRPAFRSCAGRPDPVDGARLLPCRLDGQARAGAVRVVDGPFDWVAAGRGLRSLPAGIARMRLRPRDVTACG